MRSNVPSPVGGRRWSSVRLSSADAVAEFTRACSYDRAGYGFSDDGPRPRTSRACVEELRALLRAAKVPAPYVLVGHSFGSHNVRLYAAMHPDEVAGIVLVDPAHEDR